jgi:glutathione synthase/RimK-type ligase-like ATP-grasp enzyme
MKEDELPFPLLFAKRVDVKPSNFDLAASLRAFRTTQPTGRRDQVLIVTTRSDSHADEVMIELLARGAAVRRVNVDEFPTSLEVTVDFSAGRKPRATLRSPSGEIVLDEIRTVWMRRPIISLLHSGALADASAVALRRQAEAMFHGVMALLGHAFWVNRPAALWASESKVRQLEIAATAGLTIPRTLVTNDLDSAREFYYACDERMIVKAFRGQIGSPRTAFHMIYTTQVLSEHLQHADRISKAPCIFQEQIPKQSELRVTVIGSRIFAAEITSEAECIDWRDEDAEVRFRPTMLPSGLEATCGELLRQCDLTSAAIDLIRRPDGEYVFLEINAHHDWLWIQKITGMPMVAAMGDLLASI